MRIALQELLQHAGRVANRAASPSMRRALSRYWFIVALAVEILLSVALALHRVWRFSLDLDEGFYLTAGSHVFEGQVPYRDFPFFQGPLTAYVYGISQWAAGPGILAGRATSFALFVISLLAGIRLGWVRPRCRDLSERNPYLSFSRHQEARPSER